MYLRRDNEVRDTAEFDQCSLTNYSIAHAGNEMVGYWVFLCAHPIYLFTFMFFPPTSTLSHSICSKSTYFFKMFGRSICGIYLLKSTEARHERSK